jgi:hypothetical protein
MMDKFDLIEHNKLPTAEEGINETLNALGLAISSDLKKCLVEDKIEFAKWHVKVALKEASETVVIQAFKALDYSRDETDKETILEAYPLTNIK